MDMWLAITPVQFLLEETVEYFVKSIWSCK
jgi:hypothetical protein